MCNVMFYDNFLWSIHCDENTRTVTVVQENGDTKVLQADEGSFSLLMQVIDIYKKNRPISGGAPVTDYMYLDIIKELSALLSKNETLNMTKAGIALQKIMMESI